ncbi:hypothetical protein EGW08_012437 [Elysia chlorotica]|uniref:Uncharacterized protein n=1 Tax=Elysia chlorotica TaxID=188477 RepID=A0A433TE36_ELYCH|nr:hypothetical protein EGW08_012437 [Elysia chlorotica]
MAAHVLATRGLAGGGETGRDWARLGETGRDWATLIKSGQAGRGLNRSFWLYSGNGENIIQEPVSSLRPLSAPVTSPGQTCAAATKAVVVADAAAAADADNTLGKAGLACTLPGPQIWAVRGRAYQLLISRQSRQGRPGLTVRVHQQTTRGGHGERILHGLAVHHHHHHHHPCCCCCTPVTACDRWSNIGRPCVCMCVSLWQCDCVVGLYSETTGDQCSRDKHTGSYTNIPHNPLRV